MESFKWDSHFVTGIDQVDDQHRHLVDLINRFGNLIAENRVDHDDVEQIFSELLEYSRYHFADEEALMRNAGIDPRHQKRHIDIHHKFVDEVLALRSEIASKQASTSKQSLLTFLVNWLAFHILVIDMNMARQLAAIRGGMAPAEAYEKEEQDSDGATRPLVDTLDQLFQQISARNAELQQLNQSLEQKVADRTRELSEANHRLEELSLTDALTGLPNRRHAMQSLNDAWQEANDNNTPISCMMIDADHFKEINDSYGHDEGDKVLHELSQALVHAVRTDDKVCRLGGDEFIIICPRTDLEGALKLARHVLARVGALRVPTGDGAWQGSVSIGVACRSPETTDITALIKRADELVYQAKQAGKACVRPQI
jgi:hemerythrin